MLVLGRKVGERIRLRVGGTDVWVTITESTKTRVKVGVEAPAAVRIDREELLDDDETRAAAGRAKRLAEFSVIAPFTPTN